MQHILVTEENIGTLLNMIRRAPRFALDTESAGPQLTHAKRLNVYRSHMVGISFAFGVSAYYVPIAHREGRNIPGKYVRQLAAAVEECSAEIWAHNWKHDYEVLRGEGWLASPPAKARDTMVLMWLLGLDAEGSYGLKGLAKKYLGVSAPSFEDTFGAKGVDELSPEATLDYACHDAANCYLLADRDYSSVKALFENTEMPFVFLLGEMERAGMGINVSELGRLREDLLLQVTSLREEWDFLFPGVSISSGQQLTAAFYDTGLWPTAGIERTDTGKLKTDREALERLRDTLPEGSEGWVAADLRLKFQNVSKYLTTYTDTLVDIAGQYQDRKLHTSFHHTGTVTGRLSSSGPNLQNIPAHSDIGKRIKRCFIPDAGMSFVAADYSQIELRVLAHYAGGGLAAAYKDGVDIHQRTADLVGCTRQAAKTINFATIYGAGPKKVAKQIKTDFNTARGFLNAYEKQYPEVYAIKRRMIDVATQRGYARTLSGRIRRIPELGQDSELRWRGERLAVNTPVQGSAADIMKMAMLRARVIENARMVAQVHDELTVECRTSDAEEVAVRLRMAMEGAYPLKVPLVAEPKIGATWGDVK